MIEQEFKKLAKIQPRAEFQEQARERLMQRIHGENEAWHAGRSSALRDEVWFTAFLKKLGKLMPEPHLVQAMKFRLVERISLTPQRTSFFFGWMRKTMASMVVMALVVIPTLFIVSEGQYVTAAQDSYLVVNQGQVSIQHANENTWQVVNDKIVLKTDDTVKLANGSLATITFFDDSELRLADSATVTLRQLDTLAHHGLGMIKVAMLNGRAWLQTLNAHKDNDSFTLSTPQSTIATDAASLDVQVNSEATLVHGFKYDALVTLLNPAVHAARTEVKVTADKQVTVKNQLSALAPVSLDAYQDSWVKDNMAKDEFHILALQERELNVRQKIAGILPGHFLYPLKQAREQLSRVLAFSRDSQNQVELRLANQRLNEAIVLLNQKEYDQAQQALMAYQSIVRQLAQQAQTNQTLKDRVETELIARNTKSLIAALPQLQINIVREAIGTTQELITSDPLEKAKVRLQNMTDSLNQLHDYITAGDYNSATDVLVSYQMTEDDMMLEAGKMEDVDHQKIVMGQILALRKEALGLVKDLEQKLVAIPDADVGLVGLLQSMHQQTEKEIAQMNNLLYPGLAPAELVEIDRMDERVNAFIAKIEIYDSWQGQKNQVNLLLERSGASVRNIEFLEKVSAKVDSVRTRDLINNQILQLQRTASFNKHWAVQRKIQNAQELRSGN